MQAEVPIVPSVIHNATDVAPKNEFVMRPATVRVTVLPPVDTSGWSVRTRASHVRAVRGMFLRTLGQVEEEAETKHAKKPPQSGTASGGEGGCQYVESSEVAVSFTNKNQ